MNGTLTVPPDLPVRKVYSCFYLHIPHRSPGYPIAEFMVLASAVLGLALRCRVKGRKLNNQSIVALTFISGRAYLIQGKDGWVLADTSSPWNGPRLVRRLERQGIDLSKIRLILLTHGHIDHFGNALRLKARTGAPIAIHELDAEAPRKGRNMPLHPRNTFEKVLGFFASKTRTRGFEPDVLLKGDEGDLEQYGIAAKWVRTPGHTDGSVSIALPGEAALVGDLVVGRFNALKRPAYPFWVKDEHQARESIRKLLDYAPTTFLSGHGGPFKADGVRGLFLEK